MPSQTPTNDVFAQVDYDPAEHDLDKAIAKTGHSIKDVKAVIIGHLHLDHGGGLEYFFGTDVPIYVHELELKHAFYTLATGYDAGKPQLFVARQPGVLAGTKNL
jgi:metal-dependent hydrolase (beta-lactamase superfamily II)